MKRIILLTYLFGISLSTAIAQDVWEENRLANQVARQDPAEMVFPNPAVNVANIMLNFIPRERIYMDVIDYNGNVKGSFTFSPGSNLLSFDVGFLNQGYYVLHLRSGNRVIQILKLAKT